ncbi:hypothetical protein [Spiroplasma endosymbiont of Labia minor]|uniref:hypothetical protein n=1 Tax=Spiroplasma endosymbiont of Labia minor TaxID=3066305 RepID=UPI0030D0D8A7
MNCLLKESVNKIHERTKKFHSFILKLWLFAKDNILKKFEMLFFYRFMTKEYYLYENHINDLIDNIMAFDFIEKIIYKPNTYIETLIGISIPNFWNVISYKTKLSSVDNIMKMQNIFYKKSLNFFYVYRRIKKCSYIDDFFDFIQNEFSFPEFPDELKIINKKQYKDHDVKNALKQNRNEIHLFFSKINKNRNIF